jgi:hypothetical protein
MAMPAPKDPTGVRSFLGLCGYYRIFVKNFANKCKCLYELTRDNVEFKWTQTEEDAFQNLKIEFGKTLKLSHPNFEEPFKVETDACETGIGAVLSQKCSENVNIIQCISRTLSPNEKKWPIREKEALAILWACEIFRVYLVGSKFIVETDHESLKWLHKATTPPRLVRWACSLSEYDFDIKYKPGSQNKLADALSRMPLDPSPFPFDTDNIDAKLAFNLSCINAIAITGFETINWKEAQEKDLNN